MASVDAESVTAIELGRREREDHGITEQSQVGDGAEAAPREEQATLRAAQEEAGIRRAKMTGKFEGQVTEHVTGR